MLSEEPVSSVVNTVKSEALNAAVGNEPLATPGTFATPSTTILSVLTSVTLAVIGSPLEARSLYCTKLPTLIFAGNLGFTLFIVDIPADPLLLEIVATPTTKLSD